MLILFLAIVILVLVYTWWKSRPCRHKWCNITVAGGEEFTEIDRRCTKCNKYEEILVTKNTFTGVWDTIPRKPLY
jgi:hypothetical protein